MRRVYAILVAVLLTAGVFAQTPEKMSYQAVIRNASNQLVTNQSIGMQISILQDSATGISIYVERHFPTTNSNGLVTLEIGTGTIVSGNFSTINWGNGAYFIKTETDLNGGTSYTITGTSQLLSVPYALNAKTAESIIGTGNGSSNNFYLGLDTLGGIVYYIYIGSDGQQHGLIVSKTETNTKWQNTAALVNADRTEDGVYNTNLMTDSPAKDWITTHFSSEWYLPSIDELNILWNNRFHVNKAMRKDGYTLLRLDAGYIGSQAGYFSSTEDSAPYVYIFFFRDGSISPSSKIYPQNVRAIRAF